MAQEHPAHIAQTDDWCRAPLSSETETDATPQLVQFARLPYAGSELSSPPNACLAAEPPLQRLARRGIETR